MASQKRYTKVLQVPVTDEFHKMFTERADKEGKRVGELGREMLESKMKLRQLLSEGMSTTDIAKLLHIAKQTLKEE